MFFSPAFLPRNKIVDPELEYARIQIYNFKNIIYVVLQYCNYFICFPLFSDNESSKVKADDSRFMEEKSGSRVEVSFT